MQIENLQYGDRYELANGDICVYVRRNIDDLFLQSCILTLINVMTGEEHHISEYNDNLTHWENKEFDVVKHLS